MEQESQKRKLDETGYEPSNASILCANNCGFFGSSATNNLCSKCYKDFLFKQSKDLVAVDSVGEVVDKRPVAAVGDQVKEAVVVEGTSSGNNHHHHPEKRPANRCSFCKKRVGLTGFKCKCEHTFCSLHRYSDKHNCGFDYKGAAQDAIAKANPVVKANKIEKI